MIHQKLFACGLLNPQLNTWRLTIAKLSALAICAAIFMQNGIPVVLASQSNGYEVTYKVELNGIEIGVSKRTVTINNDSIATSTHVLTPKGLATLFGKTGYTDISQMDLSGSSIRTSLSQRRSDDSSDSFSAQYEWNDRTIEFSSGNMLPMPDHDVYDFESWIMLLMLYPVERQVGSVISILERENRLRTYRVYQDQNDVIEVKREKIETRKISFTDIQDESRGFTVWIAPQFHNLVLQLVKHKKSSNLSFFVDQFRQITASGNHLQRVSNQSAKAEGSLRVDSKKE